MGGQTLSAGSWSIQGGGSDIFGTADSFHFVSQTLPADGTISARGMANGDERLGQGGPDGARQSTDPASPYYAVLVTPSNGVVVQWRQTLGAGTNQIKVPTLSVPVYLQLTRAGTTFSAATSPDGITWTPVPGSSVSVPQLTGTVLQGFAVTSHNATKISTAVFDNVTTTQSAPMTCPNGWSCSDIASDPMGGQTLSAGSWSIQGGGSDIFGTADSFHFVSQTLPADGTISTARHRKRRRAAGPRRARCTRQSTDPASPYYAVLVTPSNGVVVQWRQTLGAGTNQIKVPTLSVPVYLQLTPRRHDLLGGNITRWHHLDTGTRLLGLGAATHRHRASGLRRHVAQRHQDQHRRLRQRHDHGILTGPPSSRWPGLPPSRPSRSCAGFLPPKR